MKNDHIARSDVSFQSKEELFELRSILHIPFAVAIFDSF